MSSHYFEGPAGTGKTYNLIQSLESLISLQPLGNGQKILALTFMHGSRNRLEGVLSESQNLNRRYDCMTFDAFAGYVANRWRDLLSVIQTQVVIPIIDDEYEYICNKAAELLKENAVQRWVSSCYPIILVDEAQDLSLARLSIMQGLAASSVLLAAADEYQHLNENHGDNETVLWLSKNIKTTHLTCSRRTNDTGLLKVAHNLRIGEGIVPILEEKSTRQKKLGNFKLVLVPTWQLLAWHAGITLFNLTNTHGATILTLSSKDLNASKAIFKLKQDKQNLNKKQGTTFGPFQNIYQERSVDSLINDCIASLSFPNELMSIKQALDQCSIIKDSYVREIVYKRVSNTKKLLGYTECSIDFLKLAIKEAYQNKRRYQRRSKKVLQTMTIHQAKNQEFDNVIVFWTYALPSKTSDEYKCRLLYNAITRAKKSCTVIVLGNKNKLASQPFSG